MMPDRSLFEFYNSLFEGVVADKDELRRECFRLRHQVYCLEMRTEPPSETGLEQDEFDAGAFHALLRYRPAHAFIGTVRLIPHRTAAFAATTPVHRLAAAAEVALPKDYPPETTAEISRFAISKSFRRRTEDTIYPAAYTQTELLHDKARVIPCLALGLMTMVYRLAARNGIDGYCAVMEPALLRLLAKLGLHFHPVGPLVDYHGRRRICHATVAELTGLESRMAKERPDVREIIMGSRDNDNKRAVARTGA
jgi:N-acyl amino acid synthase of PEP-CTERM/exosortase system